MSRNLRKSRLMEEQKVQALIRRRVFCAASDQARIFLSLITCTANIFVDACAVLTVNTITKV